MYNGFNVFDDLYCVTIEISSSLILTYSLYLLINRKKEINLSIFLLFIPISIIFVLLSYYFKHKEYLVESYVECCLNRNTSDKVYIVYFYYN